MNLSEELERWVRDEAAREGVEPGRLIEDIVADRLAPMFRKARGLNATESELVLKINEGLPAPKWERFHALVARRQAESITTDELDELTALTDQIEAMNVRRVGYLTQLARLRGVSLPVVMDQLGIAAAPCA